MERIEVGKQSLLTSRWVLQPHANELVVSFEDFDAQLLGLAAAKLVAVSTVAYRGWCQRLFGVGFCWLVGNIPSRMRRDWSLVETVAIPKTIGVLIDWPIWRVRRWPVG
jgi:hypothetical protein